MGRREKGLKAKTLILLCPFSLSECSERVPSPLVSATNGSHLPSFAGEMVLQLLPDNPCALCGTPKQTEPECLTISPLRTSRPTRP